jgi:hypothetical protein
MMVAAISNDDTFDRTPARMPGKPRKNTPPLDPWADWKPQWSPKTARTPHDFQERHSPTESVTLRLTAAKETVKSQRRIVDARLWDAMSASQQRAAIEIAIAFETMGRGLGYVSSDWQRIPGATGPSSAAEAHSRLINAYIDWTRRCHPRKVSHAMVIDILVFGFSCKSLDRDRRVRAGAARENLFEGLSLYADLRGWPG